MAQIVRIGKIWYSDIEMPCSGVECRTPSKPLPHKHRIKRPLSSDRQIADAKLGEMIKLRNADKYQHVPKDISWELFRAKYLVYSRSEKKYKSSYRDELSFRYLEEMLPITKLSQITPEALERLKFRMKDKKKSPSTINRTLDALKAAMHKAESWGFIEKQEWTKTKDVKATRAKIHFWTVSELKEIIAASKGRDKTITLLGSRAGLRLGEIYWLRVEDIDFSVHRINIHAKEGWDPKDYEKRFVPMPRDLEDYLAGLPKEWEWVLGHRLKTVDIHSALYSRFIRSIGKNGAAHKLRHTYASHLAMAGVSMMALSKLLGHASVSTTERHYAHLADSHLDAVASKLPSLA